MYNGVTMLLQAAVVFGQALFAAIGIYMLLRLLPKRPARWKRLSAVHWQTNAPSDRWLRLLRIARERASFAERELLLAGCGWTADPAWYMLLRRGLLLALPFLAALAYALHGGSLRTPAAQLLTGLPVALAICLLLDTFWLRSLRTMRALQMTREIYKVSNQLLYLSDSSLHIHAKLLRCVPFTKAMRGDLERLLAEWYHDPAAALQRFKQRIGTEEGLSFTETIDALRMHESSEYYELLRVRIGDYKEKLELAKESRKESSSYVLFILAGIPILYTFQVFIYPWVMEAQKLFQSLG